MSRPTNKEQLLNHSQGNYRRLTDFIDALPEKHGTKEFPAQYMNRNVRDVLAHLHHWHLLMLDWYKTGMAGQVPVMPAEGYSWKTLPELNKMVNEKYSREKLQDVRKMFDGSFLQLQQIIARHTHDELFTKKKYKWTGTTSLAAYLISATSSHYDWGLKLIKKCLK